MADSLQPNPFTIDPAGNVQVVGLDLPAGTSQTPPAQSRVRWIRQSDGAVLAEQLGTEYGVPTPQAQLQQLVYALSGDSSASLEMSAQQSGSPDWFTQILLLCNPSGQVAKVNAQANDGAGNTHVVTLIDSAGGASFVKGPSSKSWGFAGPYSVAISIPANANQAATVGVEALPANWIPIGYFLTNAGPNWSVSSNTANSLTFAFLNPFGGAINGTFFFWIFGGG